MITKQNEADTAYVKKALLLDKISMKHDTKIYFKAITALKSTLTSNAYILNHNHC